MKCQRTGTTWRRNKRPMVDSESRTSEATTVDVWPSLPLKDWQDTYSTLHMWTQIVGKIRLTQTPLINHWWNTTLYVTSRGLTTSQIPYGHRTFQIDFDFLDHRLQICANDGAMSSLILAPRSVADFYE